MKVAFTDVAPAEEYIECVFWLVMIWQDEQLQWDPAIYDGVLRVDPGRLWTPDYYFSNIEANAHAAMRACVRCWAQR